MRSLAPPPDRNPALVYLEGMAEESSRMTMRHALDLAACLLSGGRKAVLALAWQNLRRNDVDELRERLEQSCQPATVNKMLAGVWETSFRKANLTSCSFQRLPALPGHFLEPLLCHHGMPERPGTHCRTDFPLRDRRSRRLWGIRNGRFALWSCGHHSVRATVPTNICPPTSWSVQ